MRKAVCKYCQGHGIIESERPGKLSDGTKFSRVDMMCGTCDGTGVVNVLNHREYEDYCEEYKKRQRAKDLTP